MPQYMKDHRYYAGPAKTPRGTRQVHSGHRRPGRMDSYVDQFQKAGGSMIMLAKGNRSKQVTQACQDNGGFYLGSIGGPAARLACRTASARSRCLTSEHGMEAVWRIEVEDFPAFVGSTTRATTSSPKPCARSPRGIPGRSPAD